MASSKLGTVAEYVASLPPERRSAIAAVRKVIRANLPAGYEEGMLYGMIGYHVPFSRLPDTYNGQPLCLAGLASQKNYSSLYLMGVYGSPVLRRQFEAGYRRSGKRLDMGKSCVRFRSLDDLPLDVIGKAIAAVSVDDYVAVYRASREGRSKRMPAASGKTRPARKARSRVKSRA